LCLSGSGDKTLRLWELDWEYHFPGWADWDNEALSYARHFLTLHCRYDEEDLARTGRPQWNAEDLQRLLVDLQHRGYGWLRSDGVRQKLKEMTANWQGAPSWAE